MESIDIVRIEMVKDRVIPYVSKVIRGPRQLAELGLTFLKKADREVFVVVCLNARNSINCIHIVSVGTVNKSLVSPREVMKVALLSNSIGIAFIHNHPSGAVDPSGDDIAITEQLVRCGELFEIRVIDHVIVSSDGNYMSFVERGIMPFPNLSQPVFRGAESHRGGSAALGAGSRPQPGPRR